MKKVLIAVLIACTFVSACTCSNADTTAKTRSSVAERLPAEDK